MDIIETIQPNLPGLLEFIAHPWRPVLEAALVKPQILAIHVKPDFVAIEGSINDFSLLADITIVPDASVKFRLSFDTVEIISLVDINEADGELAGTAMSTVLSFHIARNDSSSPLMAAIADAVALEQIPKEAYSNMLDAQAILESEKQAKPLLQIIPTKDQN